MRLLFLYIGFYPDVKNLLRKRTSPSTAQQEKVKERLSGRTHGTVPSAVKSGTKIFKLINFFKKSKRKGGRECLQNINPEATS
ncbi:hypothetical protein SAMN04244560_02449 [Thermoanaerobacter thermohydrosulfuricus]|uniref:Uncharacterized protein n=1 Tax=Thermoanaerobacter thermohydrosulfuricus TaxID=1516 RepID=A0A1G7UQI2_THETY|nr:hypothetical protein SAMN04244560_02449 [Thermoanaerobacter thermohydrosulfuricus]